VSRLDVLIDIPASIRKARRDGYRRRTWLEQMAVLDAQLTPLLERRLSASLHKRCLHVCLINANPPGNVSSALELARVLFRDQVRVNATWRACFL